MRRSFQPTATNHGKVAMFLVSWMSTAILVLGDTVLASNDAGRESIKSIVHREDLASKSDSVVADSFRLPEQVDVGVNNNESGKESIKSTVHLVSKIDSVVADSLRLPEQVDVGVSNNESGKGSIKSTVHLVSKTESVVADSFRLSISCAAGTYVSYGSCVSCPAGTYSNSIGATACTPCPTTFQSFIGATVCSSTPVFGNINLFAGVLQYTDKTPSGDNGPATSARLGDPRGLALDSVRQKLYIADRQNNQIRQIDLTTNVITTVLALSTYSVTYSLGRISVDGNANLYFVTADSSHQVRYSPFFFPSQLEKHLLYTPCTMHVICHWISRRCSSIDSRSTVLRFFTPERVHPVTRAMEVQQRRPR